MTEGTTVSDMGELNGVVVVSVSVAALTTSARKQMTICGRDFFPYFRSSPSTVLFHRDKLVQYRLIEVGTVV